jgi:hypothetical protein
MFVGKYFNHKKSEDNMITIFDLGKDNGATNRTLLSFKITS